MIVSNVDERTVEGFGAEWSAFTYEEADRAELQEMFDAYFRLFPWDELPPNAVGADIGCGTGRWARLAAPRVGKLHCVDASDDALAVARRNLAGAPNVEFHHASVDALPFAPGSLDFLYSLGVLHHVPDTAGAIRACARTLKPGAPMLLYLYYRFDNRPAWFRALWGASDALRRGIARMPFRLRLLTSQAIAFGVYWPLARTAKLIERTTGRVPGSFPLAAYRDRSMYVMRTDALDRFGTRLEQRFTRAEIRDMMARAGLERVRIDEDGPVCWCAVGYRSADAA
ncbi:Methyltransferase type 11 [Gemmatirosa kalamazoonensis]|uniref:Methyltransferase type 11 n=1 Tax=Gemmatirosa kalamazoonensis TaxID=861299 RepID=W0RJU1_9BACT|nr:Methyltransferase type 11 [Gemmatirosa kalamazoonensis]